MSIENPKVIGYCHYCKSPIYDGEAYIIFEDEMYEIDCHRQMNTFNDPFEE